MSKPSSDEIRNAVIERYGALARRHREETAAPGGEGCGCGPTCCTPDAEGAPGLSLGSGAPVELAAPAPGETVLDLGSGAGLDCLAAARLVGPAGRVIGVDMTSDMIDLARANLARDGATNVEFLLGGMENLPVPSDSVDAVISNCVINLTPDKSAVLREAFRVLKPGGRFRVSDIVWTRVPTDAERSDLASWAGCLAGALTVEEYAAQLEAAGFTGVSIVGNGERSGAGWMTADIVADKRL